MRDINIISLRLWFISTNLREINNTTINLALSNGSCWMCSVDVVYGTGLSSFSSVDDITVVLGFDFAVVVDFVDALIDSVIGTVVAAD